MDTPESPRRTLIRLLLTGGVALTGGLAACGSPTTTDTSPVAQSPSVTAPSVEPAPSSAAPTSPAASSGSATPESTAVTPTPDRALPLILSRTGGIAGVQDQVKISPDGTATLTHRAGTPTTTRLSVADLAALRRLLTDPALAREAKASHGTGTCADGFQYSLRTPALTMQTTDCGRSKQPTLAKVLTLILPPGGKGA